MNQDEYVSTLNELRSELGEQGRRVRKMVEVSFDAFMTHDEALGHKAVELEDEIDRADVEIEQHAVRLLSDAAASSQLSDANLLSLMTLVKVNNELERAADAGLVIAERAIAMAGSQVHFPPTARVMTNSVLGILRDVANAYVRQDAKLAELALQSEDMVSTFKGELLRQAGEAAIDGRMTIEAAFDLSELAHQGSVVADHATSIAEQVIHEVTGQIVRHRHGTWSFGQSRVYGSDPRD